MLRLLAGLAVCLALGCSSTRLTYNHLDWVIDWYLGDYLSLNTQQKDFYRQRLSALLGWHRAEQLPRYILLIDRLEQGFRNPSDVTALQESYDSVKRFWRDIMERAAPDCAQLLLSLSEAQRRSLYAAMEKQQRKLEKKFLGESDNDRIKRQQKLARQAVERFTGELTPDQQSSVARWADSLAPTQALWLESRRVWQSGLRQVLEGGGSGDEKRSGIRRLFVEPDQLWSPAYRTAFQRNEAATLAMIAELRKMLTDKQRNRALSEFESLKNDLISLSRQ